jgi:RNA polymerase sigma-70 factor, ECF subfamily
MCGLRREPDPDVPVRTRPYRQRRQIVSRTRAFWDGVLNFRIGDYPSKYRGWRRLGTARAVPSRFSSQLPPQNPCLIRSWYVNARSMTETSEMEVTNPEGLDAIFRAHYERVARVIGRVIHDQARAEELAVEVFLKWWRNPQAHGEQAEGWLYRTSVREALDELRRQTRRSRFERLFSFVRESPPTPEHLYAVNAEQHRVRTVLGALNRRHAELLLLWSQGLSYQEIAASLAVNSNYVGSLVSRAQDAFRKEYLKRYGNQS